MPLPDRFTRFRWRPYVHSAYITYSTEDGSRKSEILTTARRRMCGLMPHGRFERYMTVSHASEAPVKPPAMARVRSASHVNSYAAETEEETLDVACAPVEMLATLADADVEKPPTGFVRNPKLVKEEAVALQRKLERYRRALDAPDRLGQAQQLKEAANSYFAAGKLRTAFVGYLSSLWLVSDHMACPYIVAHALAACTTRDEAFDASLTQVASALGATIPSSGESTSNRSDESATSLLQVSCLACTRAAGLQAVSHWLKYALALQYRSRSI